MATQRTLTHERCLLRAWRREGDREAREELILLLLPVATRVAGRYAGSGEPLDDLVQVASIGLMKAVDRFDPGRGTPLRSYAERLADGELRHYLRDAGNLLRVPRRLYARVASVSRAARRLAARLGRGPTPDEIAEELEMSTADVVEAQGAGIALQTRSLDEQFPNGDEGTSAWATLVGRDDDRFELIEERLVIEHIWNALSPSEREALRLRIMEDLTYREIANALDMSAMQAVRVVRRSLDRLRRIARASE